MPRLPMGVPSQYMVSLLVPSLYVQLQRCGRGCGPVQSGAVETEMLGCSSCSPALCWSLRSGLLAETALAGACFGSTSDSSAVLPHW